MGRRINTESNFGKAGAAVYLQLTLAALFWGGAFVAGRAISKNMGHFTIAFLRFFVASVLLIMLTWRNHGRLPRLNWRQLFSIVLLGLTGVFAYNAMFFKGLQTIEASRAALIIATCPVFIALFSAVLLKEKIGPAKVIGILISLCGAVIVISRGGPRHIMRGNIGPGEFYMFCCVLSWVAYSLIGKAVMKDIKPLVAVSYSAAIGTAALFIPAFREGLLPAMGRCSVTDWSIILYLAVCATVVAFIWYYQAIRLIGPVRAGLFINFVPVFTILLSVLILKETITASLAVGAALVISGVYITNRASKSGTG
ncbi:MAG: DMT family transporter [Sedimentisphaerales bacterium]|nr:DMT family transporter [Sedimentisphaerales bacterium]